MTDFFALAQEIVGQQQARREAWARRGTNLHGWASEAPRVEAVSDVMARLADQEAKAEAYRATPEGRFHEAAIDIYRATGNETLLQCHSRGLETNANTAAVLLRGMEGPAADAARAALDDFRNRA